MASGRGSKNDSSTVDQTSSNFEEEDVAAAVSLLEFCANLEDYTPTVSSVYIYSSCYHGARLSTQKNQAPRLRARVNDETYLVCFVIGLY